MHQLFSLPNSEEDEEWFQVLGVCPDSVTQPADPWPLLWSEKCEQRERLQGDNENGIAL